MHGLQTESRHQRATAIHLPIGHAAWWKRGLFRRGVDPVQLYISIAGEGYFYLSNRYTLSGIFARDLMAPRALAARKRHITNLILNGLKR